jgi:transposase
MNNEDIKKIREIFRLKFELNLSHRTIGKMVNVSPGSVSRYSAPFQQQGLEWLQLKKMSDDEIKNILCKSRHIQSKQDFVEPNFKQVHQELKRKTVTLQLLWEEYKDIYKERAYGRSKFCQLYRAWSNKLQVTMRQHYKAGDKLFIDYAGSTVPVVDAKSGEIKEAQIFVAVMGASSSTFAEAAWSQKMPDWISSHVRAFTFFGGVTALLVPDNLRACTTKACRYEPVINDTYLAMAEHYKTAVLPARPVKPRDKAKAEIGVQVVGRWILARLRHQKFFSLFELNQAIAELLVVLNSKPFQKLQGSRLSLFEAIDKPALRPLPDEPYEYAEFKKAHLGLDYHLEIDHHYYSAPYELAKEPIDVRITENVIEIFNKGIRVASHIRSYRRGAHTTVLEHMPKKHQKHMQWTPGRFLNWANTIGPKTFDLTKRLIEKKAHPEQAYRACLGLLNLVRHYGAIRLEAACHRTIHYQIFTRRSVAEILKVGLDRLPLDQKTPTKFNDNHKNIRGPHYFSSIKQEDVTC